MKRTNNCLDITKDYLGKSVVLNGWVHRRRDHGGLIFIDLRDRSGIVQVVFDEAIDKSIHENAEKIRTEFVISVKGVVRERSEETKNPKLATGEFEVAADAIEILNTSLTPPLSIADEIDVDENLRLKYRYLDLRRDELKENFILRHKITKLIRDYTDELGFLEIETPFLTKSTPEGARDYLVPSRVNPGSFYALPQSPQIFKQILMVAGMEKYIQVVRCFRDEDLRADRQPEFTQIDMEMSFIDENDIIEIISGMLKKIFSITGVNIELPIKRIDYKEALNKYGTDAPDLRYRLELVDITDIAKTMEFKVFRTVVDNGGIVKAINVPDGGARLSRKNLDDLTKYVSQFGAKGLAWISLKGQEQNIEYQSPIVKFLKKEELEEIVNKTQAKLGDTILFVADKTAIVNESLNRLRQDLAKTLGLIDNNKYSFVWVVNFPLFVKDEKTGEISSNHHPFTAPHPQDIKYLDEDVLKVRSRAYDIVLNGIEIGGGSIRIHNSNIKKKIFSLLKISDEDADKKFGFLLEDLKYGAPPHGGIALGLDRLVMLMAKKDSIRDVIAFPKTQSAVCPLSCAPSEVDIKQLDELFISLKLPKK